MTFQYKQEPANVIRILSAHVADQIAAGEVVERPASVVKELVENSLDAQAKRIAITVDNSGRDRVVVEDDGHGMSREDARMSLVRHATSKIRNIEDLTRIASCGFRGEALPSIASVSRLRMHTCLEGMLEGTLVENEGGRTLKVCPAPPRKGTKVEVRSLFLNTPARLKFLRSGRTEEALILEIVRALALAHPSVAFCLYVDGKLRVNVPGGQSRQERMHAVMGKEFASMSRFHSLRHQEVHVSGGFALPTFSAPNAKSMHFIVNGRVVKDRALLSALRAAYKDVMFHDRYPKAVVWIEMDPALVDVNVHPSKREVRFKDPASVRAAVIACAREAIEAMHGHAQTFSYPLPQQRSKKGEACVREVQRPSLWSIPPSSASLQEKTAADDLERLDLGEPIGQVHACYIISQSPDGIFLIDQHAAAERIAYERLKKELSKGAIRRQLLLSPVEWVLEGELGAWLEDHVQELKRYGYEVSVEGDERFLIHAVPAAISDADPVEGAHRLAESLMVCGTKHQGVGEVLQRWLAMRACKASVRAGRILRKEEQDALLREMESTPNIGQCNHGRPTFVKLTLVELERLFLRRV